MSTHRLCCVHSRHAIWLWSQSSNARDPQMKLMLTHVDVVKLILPTQKSGWLLENDRNMVHHFSIPGWCSNDKQFFLGLPDIFQLIHPYPFLSSFVLHKCPPGCITSAKNQELEERFARLCARVQAGDLEILCVFGNHLPCFIIYKRAMLSSYVSYV